MANVSTSVPSLYSPRCLSLSSSHRRFNISSKAVVQSKPFNLSAKINFDKSKQDYYLHQISPDFASKIKKQLSDSAEEGFITPCCYASLSSRAHVGLSTSTDALVNSVEATAYGVMLFLGIAVASIFMLEVYYDYEEAKYCREYGGKKIDRSKHDMEGDWRSFVDKLKKTM